MEGAELLGKGRSPGSPGRPQPGPCRLGAGRERGPRGPQREKSARATGSSARTPPKPRGPPRRTFGEGYRGVLGVDGVEDALVADLRLGDEADLAADVRGAPAHGAAAVACTQSDPALRPPLRTPARPLARSLSRRLTAAASEPTWRPRRLRLPSPSLPPSDRGAAAAAAAAVAAAAAAAAQGMPGGRGGVLSRETRRAHGRCLALSAAAQSRVEETASLACALDVEVFSRHLDVPGRVDEGPSRLVMLTAASAISKRAVLWYEPRVFVSGRLSATELSHCPRQSSHLRPRSLTLQGLLLREAPGLCPSN